MRTSLVILVSVALAGCSLTRHPGKSAPGQGGAAIPSGSNVPSPPPDVLAIPDAVPRAEPRGTRGNPPFYEVFGKRYHVMASSEGWVERGTASWYGPGFHAASTSLGERYDMYGMTAAHKTLPIPCYAEVTNLRNGRKVVVEILCRTGFYQVCGDGIQRPKGATVHGGFRYPTPTTQLSTCARYMALMLSRLHQSSPKLPNSREMASWPGNGSRLLRVAKP